MKAYYYDNVPGDQRLPHDSGNTLSEETLTSLGIHHYYFPDDLESVDRIANDRKYKNRDVIEISPSTLPEYETKVKTFFDEHLHEDEEIRYIMGGGGYFDVRNEGDEWVRIRLEKGDLMIMPPGIYHRFTTDEQNYTKAMRLFKEDPKWTPLKRGSETDKNEFRQGYLQMRDGETSSMPEKQRDQALDSIPDAQRMT
ncbi:1,2-dihydroxy-3-keto-5-methylthiopentene dioxygenase [Elasticomyces elasticus]|nr:1,2-dihydroxy-3-keto-5-methylthiopentene dioxygenase [Elasticomyces elasticus]KAK3660542.1 1,2-dihydroxy-3-keto-5-methylthiopentene dioxygenase [Elasticomyces elasticus]KAK4923844.1 1,2-dihydroxy-3-keto-5-methylthiopentene dioxygenase [Elasticomyces elasticus]KAK5741854.1 1,2-dihydroxy-3-keto-5-methylthiopentene dioxygenase [Elasticomyces elasticus]